MYGIAENEEGRAVAIIALTENADQAVLRLQDMALNGIEPRITGIHVRSIAVAGGNVFVLRVPKSITAPHRVKTNQHFFIREGRRKRQLDVPEIGAAFARASGAAERIRDFRLERVARIATGQTPVPLYQGVPTVLHIAPLRQTSAMEVDPRQYRTERSLPVLSSRGGDYFKMNLDGALTHQVVGDDPGSIAYTQLFRDGRVEALRVFTTRMTNNKINVPSSLYEGEILQFMGRMLPDLVRQNLGPPFAVMYTILRASDASLGVGARPAEWWVGDRAPGFDRDVLAYPDVLIESIDNLGQALRPMFDVIWQSAGEVQSLNYDHAGNWVGRG